MLSMRQTAVIAGAALAMTAISVSSARAVELDCMALAEDVKRNLPYEIAMPEDHIIRGLLNGQRWHRFFPRTEAHKQDGIYWKPVWTMSPDEVGALKRAVQECADTVQTWGADLPFGQEGHRQRLSTAVSLIDQFYVRATALKADKASTTASVEAQVSELVARASGSQGARKLLLAAKSVLEKAPTLGASTARSHAQDLVDAAHDLARQRAQAKIRMIEEAPHDIATYIAISEEQDYWRTQVDRVAEGYVFVKNKITWDTTLESNGIPVLNERVANVIEGYRVRADELGPIDGGLFLLDAYFLGDWKEKAPKVGRVFNNKLSEAFHKTAAQYQEALDAAMCAQNAPDLPEEAYSIILKSETHDIPYQTLPQLICVMAGRGYTPSVDLDARRVSIKLTHPNAHYFNDADPFGEATFDIVELPKGISYLHEHGVEAKRGSEEARAAWQSRYRDIQNTYMSLQGPDAY